MSSYINTKIKGYTILAELSASGAQGIVYYAKNDLGAEVAIKILHRNHTDNLSLRKHFQKEAMIMASLRNDNIVRALDFYEDEETVAIIMEYLEGQDLDSYLSSLGDSKDVPVQTVTKWYGQILPAFAHAHSKGLVHRDVKPSNIFLTTSGNIKVLDFGIAKILEDAGMEHIKVSSMGSLTTSGTQYYKSPEHLLKPTSVNHLTDVYALGLMFYILTTGREPYDYDQLMDDILNQPLPEVPGYPRAVFEVIQKATAKKREARFVDCMEFLDALEAAVSGKQPVETGPPPIDPGIKGSKGPGQGAGIDPPGQSGSTTTPPPLPPPPPPAIFQKVYSQSAIALAAFLSGGFGAGYFLSQNAKRFANGKNAASYSIGAIFATLTTYVLIPYTKLDPEDVLLIILLVQVGSALGAYFLAEAGQKKIIDNYIRQGGSYEPLLGMIGLLIAFTIINFTVLFFGLAFLYYA